MSHDQLHDLETTNIAAIGYDYQIKTSDGQRIR
jgi:hypothetical protein